MARDRTPVLKRCRALGIEPSVLGLSKKPSIRHKDTNQRPKKMSEYGMQLREKQKAKFVYGILEKPFRHLYERAIKMKGLAGENLLQLLERRLDNVVYRLGFTRTRPEARQFVSHGHVLVNGKRVDIPSYEVKPGEVVSIREKSRSSSHVKDMHEATARVLLPSWLTLDDDRFTGTVTGLPPRGDIDFDINERLIIELFSK